MSENARADEQAGGPESTAVRVALWRAMHVLIDPRRTCSG
jgi:hypothetical protein